MKRIILAGLLIISFSQLLFSQVLKPGLDTRELAEVLCVSAQTGGVVSYYTDSNYVAEPEKFRFRYRSPEMGLLNLWELWISDEKTAIITIRGTIPSPDSWLANFYAAMVPAKGQLALGVNDTFNYELASDPKAAIHVGWLISTAFLSRDILPRIDSCYKNGIKDFIITGHSQGGAISYLLTAYLLNLKQIKQLPADICFKTYCTAAPKPGNLYFAYDYELATQGGWAFNVVNTEDWVPEVPISIQTLSDFNNVNPFTDARSLIKKQKFPKNLVFRHVYNKLENPGRKAQRNYEKYLGRMLGKEIGKRLNGFKVDNYYHSSYYVRTGTIVLLKPTPEYYVRFPQKPGNGFVNHYHQPYLYLIDKSKLEKKQ